MPDFPPILDAPRSQVRAMGLSFVDSNGRNGSSYVELPVTVSDALLNALRTALGNGSNAALEESRYTNKNTILSRTTITAYDEKYPSIEDVAVFQFQDNTGDVQTLELPAPDSTLFFQNGDRLTIDPARVLSSAIIAAALAALNDNGGTYTYSRGYKATHRKGRAGKQAKVLPQFTEPGAGDLPGGGDGA